MGCAFHQSSLRLLRSGQHVFEVQGKWGEDLYSPVPRPMFLVRLIAVAGQLMFDPPLDSIEHSVLEAYDAIVLRSANIDDITTKVLHLTQHS